MTKNLRFSLRAVPRCRGADPCPPSQMSPVPRTRPRRVSPVPGTRPRVPHLLPVRVPVLLALLARVPQPDLSALQVAGVPSPPAGPAGRGGGGGGRAAIAATAPAAAAAPVAAVLVAHGRECRCGAAGTARPGAAQIGPARPRLIRRHRPPHPPPHFRSPAAPQRGSAPGSSLGLGFESRPDRTRPAQVPGSSPRPAGVLQNGERCVIFLTFDLRILSGLINEKGDLICETKSSH